MRCVVSQGAATCRQHYGSRRCACPLRRILVHTGKCKPEICWNRHRHTHTHTLGSIRPNACRRQCMCMIGAALHTSTVRPRQILLGPERCGRARACPPAAKEVHRVDHCLLLPQRSTTWPCASNTTGSVAVLQELLKAGAKPNTAQAVRYAPCAGPWRGRSRGVVAWALFRPPPSATSRTRTQRCSNGCPAECAVCLPPAPPPPPPVSCGRAGNRQDGAARGQERSCGPGPGGCRGRRRSTGQGERQAGRAGRLPAALIGTVAPPCCLCGATPAPNRCPAFSWS